MSQYFAAFPSINYSGTNAKNITLRTNIVKSFSQNASNFYTYLIKDGETADAIAYDYYNDANYIWVIYMVNNIIDPYYEWPLSTVEFEKFIIDKYGSLASAKQTTVYYKKIPINYYVNDTTNEFILASLYFTIFILFILSKLTNNLFFFNFFSKILLLSSISYYNKSSIVTILSNYGLSTISC